MHFILSLFDAPAPASGALQALRSAGVDSHDIALIPPLGSAAPGGSDGGSLVLPEDPEALRHGLVDRGVPLADAQLYTEGVERGGFLLVVRSATLTATRLRTIVSRFGALPLAAHQARWDADPALRYGGSGAVAPEIVGPRSAPPPNPTDD